MQENNTDSFERVKDRLDEIVEAVSDENISLDDALKLYEEAVQLGLAASSLLEENLEENNALYDEELSTDQDTREKAEEATADSAAKPQEESDPVDTDSE